MRDLLFRRKRTVLLGAAMLAIVFIAGRFFFSTDSTFNRWRTLRTVVTEQERDLAELRQIRDRVIAVRAEQEAITAQMGPPNNERSLLGRLQQAKEGCASTAVILGMKPETQTVGNLYRLDSVSLKLAQISLGEMIDLCHAVEGTRSSIAVREISIGVSRSPPRVEAMLRVEAATSVEKRAAAGLKSEEAAAPLPSTASLVSYADVFNDGRKLKKLREEAQRILKATFPEKSIASPDEELRAMGGGLREESEKLTFYRQLTAPSALDILREFLSIFPSDLRVQIEELKINRDYLRIAGQTDSFQSVGRIKSLFSGSPDFQVDKIRSGAMKSLIQDGRIRAVEFNYVVPLARHLPDRGKGLAGEISVPPHLALAGS
jgi:hypothetical protein